MIESRTKTGVAILIVGLCIIAGGLIGSAFFPPDYEPLGFALGFLAGALALRTKARKKRATPHSTYTKGSKKWSIQK